MKFPIGIFVVVFFIDLAASLETGRAYEVDYHAQMSYKYYETGKTWAEAAKTCRSEMATLAMPSNYEEMEALVNVINKHYGTNPVSAFFVLLGFHNLFRLEEYVTITGLPLQHVFHKFGDGEPNHPHERCGSMWYGAVKKGLNDITCASELTFVCQRRFFSEFFKLSGYPFVRSNKFEWMTGQPHNWGYASLEDSHNNFSKRPKITSVYKLHLNGESWPLARTICEAEGAHLAIIDDAAELNFLVKLINVPENFMPYLQNDTIWLGYHDYFTKGEFITVIDDNLKFGGENLTGDDNKHCGAMDDKGTFKTMASDTIAKFICEKEIIEDTTIEECPTSRVCKTSLFNIEKIEISNYNY